MSKQRELRNEPEEWTAKGFLEHFLRVEAQMNERKWAFILGAGASITSGVPSGLDLVDRWLKELHARNREGHKLPIDQWATSDTLDIEDFEYDRRAEFYPQIYDRRFGDDREVGYAYLEDVMKNAHPGLGYSMLAQILGRTRHKVVITTNFDNLVADAVLLFTDTFAQTCGHESLTGYVRVQPRRPLIAKIHRDLLLGPQNDPSETEFLHEKWAGTLRRFLSTYTPLVIGYGGNDGSLMNFLYSLEPNSIPGTMFWFYRRERPNKRIRKLVARQSGKLVAIDGFDELMTLLAQPLGFGLLDGEIEKRAKKWADGLRDDWKRVSKVLDVASAQADDELTKETSKEVREAFDKIADQRAEQEGDWWAWELRAQQEADPEKREAIYRAGLKELPRSAELTGNFALFMHQDRKDYDEAERFYREGLRLNPENAVNTRNFAVFLYRFRNNYDEAEELCRRALELDPEDAVIMGVFGILRQYVRKDYAEAERLYRRALELDPDNANNIANLAILLQVVRKEYDAAERLYRRALEVDPDNANVIGSFAAFMSECRGDYEEAERLYRRALELDSENVGPTVNFVDLLLTTKRYAEAATLSDRAWSLPREGVMAERVGLTLYRGLLLLQAQKDDVPALGRLKTLLTAGFLPFHWSFDDVFGTASSWLAEDNRKLYGALADAISDQQKVGALDAFPRWTQVEPIPLDEPWEDLGS